MFLKPVNEYDVLKQLNSLSTSCASGVEGITHITTSVSENVTYV